MYTLPPMMSQQSSLELCLATSSRVKTLDMAAAAAAAAAAAGWIEVDGESSEVVGWLREVEETEGDSLLKPRRQEQERNRVHLRQPQIHRCLLFSSLRSDCYPISSAPTLATYPPQHTKPPPSPGPHVSDGLALGFVFCFSVPIYLY
jgi:hypothetical protein